MTKLVYHLRSWLVGHEPSTRAWTSAYLALTTAALLLVVRRLAPDLITSAFWAGQLLFRSILLALATKTLLVTLRQADRPAMGRESVPLNIWVISGSILTSLVLGMTTSFQLSGTTLSYTAVGSGLLLLWPINHYVEQRLRPIYADDRFWRRLQAAGEQAAPAWLTELGEHLRSQPGYVDYH